MYFLFLGFSSDGFSAFLRNMQTTASIPTLNSDCPQEFKWFFFGAWDTPFLCIQDAIHMCVKAFRRLMSKQLRIGSGLASRSILLSLLENSPKMLTGLSTNELTDNKDAMNYGIVEKVCSDKIISKLTQPQEFATKAYLKLIRHIMRAYIEPDSTPTERIESAFYTVFVCRLWKESIGATKDTNLKENFITTNLHVCVELNAHALLRFMIKCRDLDKPELFLPSQTGSQQCESTFRTWRSMTTTFFTAINFDMKELLQKIKRLFFMEKIATSDINFNFARQNKKSSTFIPKNLPTNDEINQIVRGAWDEAQIVFRTKLGNRILCNNLTIF